MLLDEERRKNNDLSKEVTRYATMVEEKNELIKSIRAESQKYKSDFENLNNQIMLKLTDIMNKPGPAPQNMQEMKRVLASVHKIDRDISQLKQNNKEIISKHDNNFYILNDKIGKATHEMKNSKRTEQITKTIIKPYPVKERIVRAPPVVRRLREIPVSSTINYQTKCTCNCNRTLNSSQVYCIEKCPMCNVGMVNTMSDRKSIPLLTTRVESVRARSPVIHNKIFNESNKTASYLRGISNERATQSAFSTKHIIENSVLNRDEPVKYSKRTIGNSIEPLNKRISSHIRHSPLERTSFKELDPYLIKESVIESRNVRDRNVKTSISRT